MKRMPFLLLPLFLAANLFAQTTPGKQLTFKQAIDAALEKNIDILRAQNTLEGQQSAVLAAYGNFLPNLSASGGWARQETHQPASTAGFYTVGGVLYPTAGTSGVTTSNSYRTGVQASLTLFDGFNNTSNLNKASATAVSNEFTLYRTRQSIVFQTQTLYLQVLRNRTLLSVSEDNLKRSQQQLQRIVESNKVGAVAAADVYRQQVQTANDELSLIRAQNAYDNSKADLLFLLSLDVVQDYDISDSQLIAEAEKADAAEAKGLYSDYNQLVNQGLASRPDYQASLYSKQSAESDVTISRSGYLPTISASAGYSLNNSEFSNISDNKFMNWGISFSLPLFNGFQTNTQVQAAKLRLRNSEDQVAQTVRQVQVDVRKAMLNFESSIKALDVSVKAVFSAEEDRRIAEERYNLGAGILLDLLTANANYTQALSNKVNAQYDLVLAKQQLKYVVGAEKY
jgi:outer membrane protein